MAFLFASFAGVGLGVLLWYFSIIPPEKRNRLFRPSTVGEVSEEDGWKNVMQTLVDDIESVHQDSPAAAPEKETA